MDMRGSYPEGGVISRQVAPCRPRGEVHEDCRSSARSHFRSLRSCVRTTAYTAELLPPPADVPGYATEAYALNNRGQVFGRAVSIAARGPVLWTDGIPAWLPVPNGHHWYDDVGVHFINSSGDVVSVVQDARATGNEGVRPILWVDGAATQVPLPVPRCDGYLERPVDSESEWGLSSWPVGFNKAGHILLSACNNFWIWDGSSFELLAQPSPVPGCLFLQNAIAFGSNHLNDADHASLDRTWFIDWGCPLPARQPGVFISPTDFVSLPEEAGFAADINNRDQVVIWFRDSSGIVNLRLWNGRQMVELGQGGYQSLNNLGEVAFMTGSPLRPHLFRDGVVRPVALPAEVANLGGFLLLNDGGQIAGWDPVSGRAVILTPVPTIKSFAIPAALTACKSGTATITLEYRAAGNLLVSLSSSAPGVSLPASVLFKAGVSKKSFAIRTTPVASLQDVTITATLGDERLDSYPDAPSYRRRVAGAVTQPRERRKCRHGNRDARVRGRARRRDRRPFQQCASRGDAGRREPDHPARCQERDIYRLHEPGHGGQETNDTRRSDGCAVEGEDPDGHSVAAPSPVLGTDDQPPAGCRGVNSVASTPCRVRPNSEVPQCQPLPPTRP